jgi:hypothetical protein
MIPRFVLPVSSDSSFAVKYSAIAPSLEAELDQLIYLLAMIKISGERPEYERNDDQHHPIQVLAVRESVAA